jgi:hypothetical protein
MKEKNEKEKKKYPHGRRKAYQAFNSPVRVFFQILYFDLFL